MEEDSNKERLYVTYHNCLVKKHSAKGSTVCSAIIY